MHLKPCAKQHALRGAAFAAACMRCTTGCHQLHAAQALPSSGHRRLNSALHAGHASAARPLTCAVRCMALKAGADLDGERCAQALPQLQAKLRIERARMRLRLLAPLGAKPELERLLAEQGATIEYQDLGLNGQQARGRQYLHPRECAPAACWPRRAPQLCGIRTWALTASRCTWNGHLAGAMRPLRFRDARLPMGPAAWRQQSTGLHRHARRQAFLM